MKIAPILATTFALALAACGKPDAVTPAPTPAQSADAATAASEAARGAAKATAPASDAVTYDAATAMRNEQHETLVNGVDTCSRNAVLAALGRGERSREAIRAFARQHCTVTPSQIDEFSGIGPADAREVSSRIDAMADSWIDTISKEGQP